MLTNQFEIAWRADEIVRLGRAIKYKALREKHLKALLDEIDRGLPDYPRPLKEIRTKKKLIIKKLLKSLLP